MAKSLFDIKSIWGNNGVYIFLFLLAIQSALVVFITGLVHPIFIDEKNIVYSSFINFIITFIVLVLFFILFNFNQDFN